MKREGDENMLKSKGRNKTWTARAGLSMFVLLAVFVAAVPLVFSAVGPTITNLQPTNGSFINYNTPTISANYSSDGGINVSSVKMWVDGDAVTPDSISATSVSYTPTGGPLGEGLHSVTINVSDDEGNPNSTSWSFTVDTIPPTILFTYPTPANESTNTTGFVNITVNVTDPVPGSGLVDAVNISVWDETGLYLNNINASFDGHKYYYIDNVSSPGIPLPTGTYTYKDYAKDVAGNVNVSETRVITVNEPALPWDLNNNNQVDVGDLVIVGNHFGETGTPGWIQCDFNNNGQIDVGDLVIVGNHFGGVI